MLDASSPRSQPLSRWNSLFSFTSTLTLLILPALLLWRQHSSANAEQEAITQVWQHVQAQGSYAFSADISQVTISAAVTNIGATGQRHDLKAETMQKPSGRARGTRQGIK